MNFNRSSTRIHTSDYVESDEHFDAIVNQIADQQRPIQFTPTAASFIESLREYRITSDTLKFYSKGCVICLDSFAVNGKAIRLPCQHVYHRDCIVEWLNQRNVCPLCMRKLPEEKKPEPSSKRRRVVLTARDLDFQINNSGFDLVRHGFVRIPLDQQTQTETSRLPVTRRRLHPRLHARARRSRSV
ncbi:hypothetical protein LguiA_013202 [Lonicera macranthoides]